MTSQINLDQQVVVPYNFTSSPSTPRLEALRLEGIVARRSLHGSTTSLQSCLKDPLVRTMVIFVCVCGDWFGWKLLSIKDPLFLSKNSCFVAFAVFPVCVSHPCIVRQILFNSHSCDFIYCLCLCVVIVFLFLAESEAHWTILILERKKHRLEFPVKTHFPARRRLWQSPFRGQ